jgi:hypothetical protein
MSKNILPMQIKMEFFFIFAVPFFNNVTAGASAFIANAKWF